MAVDNATLAILYESMGAGERKVVDEQFGGNILAYAASLEHKSANEILDMLVEQNPDAFPVDRKD